MVSAFSFSVHQCETKVFSYFSVFVSLVWFTESVSEGERVLYTVHRSLPDPSRLLAAEVLLIWLWLT